ncbi:MAG: trigger factor [Acholeplasmatales bacterium]|nr:trigger factor [Acholeplasmatales bacterium]
MIKEKIENSRLKLTFDVTKEDFEKALDKAFIAENEKVTIQGFRKGKAPRSMFEKTYGVESLFESAINVILNDKVQEAIKDEEVNKNAIGNFEPLLEEKIERGKDFKVSLVIDIYPEVTLPEYKGVEIKKQDLTVSDEDVEKAVQALAKKDATMEAKKDGVIEKGDYATFDFVGTVDGKEFEGGKADNYELQIGSGQFIPGFEDQMIGMKSEEVKDINVTFPENYGHEALAGKPAVFKVTVHEIKVEKFPEFTDEYVAGLKIDGVNNLEELKLKKKTELEDAKKVSEKDRQVDELINKILDAAKVDMPKTLVEQRFQAIKNQYENQAKMYNIPFEMFLQYMMQATVEQFNDIARRNAERQALFDVICGKIIEEEKLAPTKEEIEAKAEAEAKATGKTQDEVLKDNYSTFFNNLAYEKLINFLLSNAKEI